MNFDPTQSSALIIRCFQGAKRYVSFMCSKMAVSLLVQGG